MKLSRNAFLLWLWRLEFVCITAFFIMNISGIHHWVLYALVCFCVVFSAVIYYLRYRKTQVTITQNTITLTTGVVIRKEQTAHRKNICAEKVFTTPFMKALHLKTPIIFCEGVALILPPLTEKQASLLKRTL